MSSGVNGLYEFGDFRFDAEKRVVWRGDDIVPLAPRAADVLYLLISRQGNLVERQEIIDTVWKDTFVEDGNLNHAVSALRKVLGEKVIQTVPKRGYRFTAELAEVSEVLIERQTLSNTVIEEQEEIVHEPRRRELGSSSLGSARRRTSLAALAVAVMLAAAGGWALLSGQFGGVNAERASIRVLAVLPLRSFSRDNADEELRLRITDALITKLGGLGEIIVRPTNSVLRFAGEDQDAVAAGKTLGADAVLDGRVQQENGRLRVTLQLISVADSSQLWAGQFDGRADEILALQDLIAGRFRQELSLGAGRQESRKPALNNESYEAYLKGRYLWNQRKKESYDKALEYFERSVQIDPAFALGYTGIADCYHLLQQRNVISTRDAFDKAEAAARRALELDPNLSEAHTSMGSVSIIRYARWSEAENYYRRAIELDPNSAEPYARLGMLYNAWGRFDEAHAELLKARELDPTSVNNAIYLGANYYFSKQYDRAAEQFTRILEFAPATERAHFFLTRIYELTGQYDKAVEHALQERATLRPDSVEPLRSAYQAGGIRAFWRKQIELLTEEARDMHGLENHIASRYVLLGEHEIACDLVAQNLENLGSMQNYGRVDPLFEPLSSNPRFVKMMAPTAPPQ